MAFLQRTMNRGSVSTGYDIDNSCKFEADNQEELLRTPSSASNMKTWTVSLWFKRTELGTYQMLFGSSDTYMYFDTSNNVTINFRGASENFFLITNRLFRDTSAWYHFVVVCDFTNSTAADRGRLYVNGVRETSYSNSTYQNAHSGVNSYWNNTVAQSIGGQNASTTFQSSGYMAEVHAVDGSALTADSFGEFDSDTGLWIPKEYDGSYGTNGFYLDYSSASDMGNDSSGNNNDFSPQNINQNDQATDTCTNNFATFNPLLPDSSEKEGATVFINPDAGADTNLSTIAVANGKWYAEFKASSDISGDNGMVGVAANSGDSIAGRFLGQDAWSVGLLPNGSYYINSSATSYLGTTFNQDIISVALDMDNKKVYFAKNGTWGNSGNPATGTNGIALPSAYEDYEWFIGTSLVLNTATYDGNYGGYTTISISSAASDANGYGNFEYAPPSGYYALCGKNLAEYG